MATWAIKDNNSEVLPHFLGCSRIELGCKVMPARYDVFCLHVSASYRELFERALQQVLQRNGWRIIRIKPRKPSIRAPNAAHAQGEDGGQRGYGPGMARGPVDARQSVSCSDRTVYACI
ncbi:MAG: hypothetical protein WAN86_25745 [Hyphomicrobiaceae bacterium]